MMIAIINSRVDVEAGKKLQGAGQQTWVVIKGDFQHSDEQAAAQQC